MAAILVVVCWWAAIDAAAGELPRGYWSREQSQEILDKTMTVRLDPDLSHLSRDELAVIKILIEAGEIIQELYENSRHHQATTAYADLVAYDRENGHGQATQNLLVLYRLFRGPLARDLSGDVIPFLPVDHKVPGKNVYPWGIGKDEVNRFLRINPKSRPSILGVRTIVRRSTNDNLELDRQTLETYGDLVGVLNPEFPRALEELLASDDRPEYYTVPYAVAYAKDLIRIHGLLTDAASLIEATDIDFARYLRHRAVDLLRNDYEAGDASWINGDFVNLNAQIGSYETYDDELFGVKSFFGLSVLVVDRAMESSLNTAVGWLQEFENLLPYEAQKRVRDDIPIGVYNVVADFGQSRGTNSATILPNESYITRRYGRTILLRRNLLEDPGIFAVRLDAFKAAVADEFHDMYQPSGDFFRTMFHEIGHYLGPDRDKDDRTLDIALEEDVSIIEELKSDLVSLFLAKRLHEKGYYDDERLRAVQTAGIRRVLRKNQPKKSQAYATMQLMQMNYFLQEGLLEYDARQNRLLIHFDRYHESVESMLREVLALQYEGDKAAADRFIDRYSTWDKKPHGRISGSMKDAERYRYGIVRYAALGE